MLYDVINFTALTEDRIGDQILSLPIIRSITNMGVSVNWVTSDFNKELLQEFISNNLLITFSNKPLKNTFHIDVCTAGHVWEHKSAVKKIESILNLWCPDNPILDSNWGSYTFSQVINKLYQLNLPKEETKYNPVFVKDSLASGFLKQPIYSPKTIPILLAPDAYIQENRIPISYLKDFCSKYTPTLLYSKKNEALYSHLKGTHLVGLQPKELITTIASSEKVISGMTGIAHLASLLDTKLAVASFISKNLPLFKPLRVDLLVDYRCIMDLYPIGLTRLVHGLKLLELAG